MLSAAFLADLMSQRTIGISKVCSIGNKADVDECDLLEYLLGDTETDVVALYLESIPRGRLFVEIATRATKPIVVLKGGKSEAGARAAMSHTSSLSGTPAFWIVSWKCQESYWQMTFIRWLTLQGYSV